MGSTPPSPRRSHRPLTEPPTILSPLTPCRAHRAQFAGYAPRAPETIELTLPAVATLSRQPLAVGRFVVNIAPGSVALSGALIEADVVEEAALRSLETHTLTLRLTGTSWQPDVGLDGEASAALLRGFASAQSEPRGWNAAVTPLLTSAELVRLDDTTVELTLPQLAGYDIASPETISLVVPPSATRAAQPLAAPQPLTILPIAGIGRCAGSLMTAGNDASVQAEGALTLSLRLVDESWVDQITPAVAGALVAGIRSAQVRQLAAPATAVPPPCHHRPTTVLRAREPRNPSLHLAPPDGGSMRQRDGTTSWRRCSRARPPTSRA